MGRATLFDIAKPSSKFFVNVINSLFDLQTWLTLVLRPIVVSDRGDCLLLKLGHDELTRDREANVS